jgi:hypothetical protein
MYVKATDKESEVFAYLRQNFRQIIEAKMKEGIFVGPQTALLFGHQDFSQIYIVQKMGLEGI